MTAFYNEIDPYAAQWLRNLIAAGHIAPGVVDERSIEDILPSELKQYTQCHFFAGIGIWSYALRNLGWSDDRPVWTGSCPCQPFSAAGKGAGFADERHLWPAWHYLISECKPAAVFGEQVASADSGPWIDLVQDDMEALGYAFGAVPFPAAGVGAPHIRDRLYFVANANGHGSLDGVNRAKGRRAGAVAKRGGASGMGDAQCNGLRIGGRPAADIADQPSDGPVRGFWADAEWIFCRDEKHRPVEPGTFPLATGVAGRVGRLRAYGNAINAEAAEAFIAASLDEREVLSMSTWQQGADAARAGHPATACPYPATEYHFVTWLNGWAAAAHEMARERERANSSNERFF